MTAPIEGTWHSVEHLLRDITPQVLGALTRRHRDFAAAEDAVQEALLDASMQWPREGVPANPAGWLYTAARRRLTDEVRSDIARRRREEAVANEEETHVPAVEEVFEPEEDDTLLLLFMCAHPALTPVSAIAAQVSSGQAASVHGSGTGSGVNATAIVYVVCVDPSFPCTTTR